MQKQAVILSVSFTFLCSCAVFHKTPTETPAVKNVNSSTVLLELAKSQNISNENFFISKANVEITGNDGNEKLLCSIKYNVPGMYLISVRGRTGIEAARLFITGDSVLINDRINRKLYYGSSKKLIRKYGFNESIIPLILGDYLNGDLTEKNSEKCVNGLYKKVNSFNGNSIDYTIDCRILKVVSATTGYDNKVKLKYSGFITRDKILVPGEIEIRDLGGMTKILIKIEKIEYPWDGKIEFIPGSKFERIPLL